MSDAPLETYREMLLDEGEHWGSFSMRLLQQGIVPYCCDFRLHLTQLVLGRGGLPFHLGAGLLPTRFREVRNVLGAAAARIAEGGRDVLDLGCGGGWFSLELARQGGHVLGLDVSRENLRLATYFAERDGTSRPHLYPSFVGLPLRPFGSATYAYADLNTALGNVASESRDVVTVWDSLHHIRDLSVTLAEAARVLRPGGFLVGHDFVGPGPDAARVAELFSEGIREIFRTLSSPDLAALRRHVTAIGRTLDLGENAVDLETRFGDDTRAYIESLLAELRAELRLDGRDLAPPASPFEEVSVSYLLTELERRFDVTAFYTMGAYWPEDMPPPPPDPGDGGAELFHYLSYLFLILDDLLVDSGVAAGRYVCFAGVPKGSHAGPLPPGFRRSASGWLSRLRRDGPSPAGSAELDALRSKVRFLEAENRILRRIAAASTAPAADAHRLYAKVVRPLLLRMAAPLRTRR